MNKYYNARKPEFLETKITKNLEKIGIVKLFLHEK